MKRTPVYEVSLDKSVTQEIAARRAAWEAQRGDIPLEGHDGLLLELVGAIAHPDHPLTGKRYHRLMRRFARRGLPWLSKEQLLHAYRELCARGLTSENQQVLTRLQTKPTRTHSGVAVVTVLTKPYPCPGQCIFCPTDVRMPKSYLHDEPGAQRAERHAFDPFAQTAGRIAALERLGHPTDKIELLVLGGTWSSYRRDYQEWFIRRCFDAMNGVDSATLTEAHQRNETAPRRNVGLVIETRQDHIDADELRWLRALGVTKVQIGIQSLDERTLALNHRGHDVQATRDAFRQLRLAGFKIHGHWMANLLGATPASDIADYGQLWEDPAIRPDELKIYPCMLVENAELHEYWLRGEYQPYSEETVRDVIIACKTQTPRYARLTRIIRDIPTTNVVAGNKKANLRQLVQRKMQAEGLHCNCIRCREIRREPISRRALTLKDLRYETDVTTEHFLSFERADGRLAGFLRLSLPHDRTTHVLPELVGHAMIREVHVYGPVVGLGESSQGEAQHLGLGAELIEEAKRLSRQAGFSLLAVISAVGTRHYYRRHGFEPAGLYMVHQL